MSAPSAAEPNVAAQRMDALGRLAGGIAHDFNNMLMVINGYAEMLAQSVGEDDHDSKEAVQTILDASERAAGLTRELLLFSRRQFIEAVDVEIGSAIHHLEPMLQRLLPADVRLAIQADDPGPVASVDGSQLDQLICNLVANARDAMPSGGTVTVAVQEVRRDGFTDASGEQAAPGAYVLLTVSDTGAGLDDGIRLRVFEPFFTTKTAAGNGLGLATVYGIVKSGGGYLDVHSVVGDGTTFEVYFPLVGAHPAREPVSGS